MEDRKLQWHPAFCSAMRLEFLENKDDLDYYNEYNLSEKPLQMDMLIIRKTKNNEIKNPIGKLFKEHNIVEYKSPEDGINIDKYFKTIAYACLYKSFGENVDSRQQDNITITIVQERKPRNLFKALKQRGATISNPYLGIYYISGSEILFSTQIIVSGEIDNESHIWLTALTNDISKKEAYCLIKKTKDLVNKQDKENADALLDVTIRANEEIFTIIGREETDMCEALEEIMAPVIDEKLKKRTEEVTQQVTKEVTEVMTNNFALRLLDDNMPIEFISKHTGLSEEEILKLRKQP